ncbi:hypothetical protein PR202_gb15126 [Eleusine coracana subsp. coracana]|uniref:Uncharacterized protein n=1 Tax=Eleusine coracana subsp. coracana TaxID=191504 RepID=A0AAV5EUQ4_ELECO|nr:hypothetical protein PR202_gb15126 [Eleusine coracana subsp. coracana]
MVFFFLAPNAGLPIRPVDARLQNESVDASEEHDASRDSPDRSSNSWRRIPAGALREGSNVGRTASFFSSAVAAVASTSLPGLGEGFRPRGADTERVLLTADRGSESPPPEAGDRRRLELAPDDIAGTWSTRFLPTNLPKTLPLSQAQCETKSQGIAAEQTPIWGQSKRGTARGSRASSNPRRFPAKSAGETLPIFARATRHWGMIGQSARSKPRRRKDRRT